MVACRYNRPATDREKSTHTRWTRSRRHGTTTATTGEPAALPAFRNLEWVQPGRMTRRAHRDSHPQAEPIHVSPRRGASGGTGHRGGAGRDRRHRAHRSRPRRHHLGRRSGIVAAGEQNARIDRLSAHIKATYTGTFFMAIHHEPENDVDTTAGSGMTAKDYAAMFAHTAKRMRVNGVTNVVFVMAYMNIDKWNQSPWWRDLYPGNDAVDAGDQGDGVLRHRLRPGRQGHAHRLHDGGADRVQEDRGRPGLRGQGPIGRPIRNSR
jgi:hypothetical protein